MRFLTPRELFADTILVEHRAQAHLGRASDGSANGQTRAQPPRPADERPRPSAALCCEPERSPGGVNSGGALVVFVAALGTALVTGAGALPFAFGWADGARWLGAANAVASGVMLGASGGLIIEGIHRSSARTALGVLGGVALIYAAAGTVKGHDALELGTLRGADAHKALLIVGVMTVHSAAEGIGVGASFGGGDTFGLLIAAAIAIQNIPEGLAISLVLVPRGTRVRTAAGWSVFSSLPQALLAVPAFLFVEQVTALLPAVLGFAAGAMVWMVARELLPESLRQTSVRIVVSTVTVTFFAMLALQVLLL